MKPQRIQLKRTKGWRMPPNTVKVDRSTKWGNPFPVSDIVSQAEAVELYRDLASKSQRCVDLARRNLRGKNLACWCKPGTPCHADVLLEIANEGCDQ